MIKEREVKFSVHYKGIHEVFAELAIQAVGILAVKFPELSNMNNFQFSVDRHNNIYLTEVSEETKQLQRDQLKAEHDFRYIVSNKDLPLRSGYEAMLGAFAEMFLDESIRVKREETLRALIEDALDSGDKEAFMKYTTELKEVVKV